VESNRTKVCVGERETRALPTEFEVK